MQSIDNSRSSGKYYYRIYWVHALIRHYLTTGRKYALIIKYALNKRVRLLTRLYSTTIHCMHGIHLYKYVYAIAGVHKGGGGKKRTSAVYATVI